MIATHLATIVVVTDEIVRSPMASTLAVSLTSERRDAVKILGPL